jgi:hypothetical protein
VYTDKPFKFEMVYVLYASGHYIRMSSPANGDDMTIHLAEEIARLDLNRSILPETKQDEDDKKCEDEPSRATMMDFWVKNLPKYGSKMHDKKHFVLDADAPVVTLGNTCKGELMRHQAAAVWMLNELENSESIPFVGDFGLTTIVRTNRYTFKSPMGSGKTKTAIGLILHSPRPKIKPIYWIDTTAERWFLQERIFPMDAIIWPTVVVTRSAIYSQWHEHVVEFSTLRIFSISDSKALIRFVELANNSLAFLNANYDIILIDYKTITGKTDAIVDKCAALYEINTKKSKHIVPLLMNTLSRRCFARVIYDDSEFHMKAAAFENASSCIYMSATHQYGGLRGASKLYLRASDHRSFENQLEFPSYTLDTETFQNIVMVSIDQEFLTDSVNLGLPGVTISQISDQLEISTATAIPVTVSSMMPAEPEVWICPVVNTESKTIDIIRCLCNDAKIMESVNNLAVTSFADVIKTLMAGRFEVYKNATRIVSYWSSFDISSIARLPKPPEGLSFTVDNLRRCEPITFAWRDIANRITDLIASEQKIIDNEKLILERIKESLGDSDCGICLEPLRNEAVGIMLCCNKILHIKCILRWSARRCPFCRVAYGNSSKDTFAPMHHETDFSSFVDAKSATIGMETILKGSNTDELTKLSVLRTIVLGRFAELKRTRVRLKKIGTIIYDPAVEAKCEDRIEKLKILIYSSADNTLKKIEADLPIKHAHLTASAASTFKKIKAFRESNEPFAILANSWRDAAGIDFKTATDVVIMNYVDAGAVVQQMVARLLRMGRTSRARIWLISFKNECDSWLSTHCEPITSEK